MSAIEPLCCLLGINPQNLSKAEHTFLEAEFFYDLCEQLKEIFRKKHREFFRLMKLTIQSEEIMLEENFIRLLINDTLYSKEYTLEGIARYTNTHEDVIHEIVAGNNSNPSAMLLRKLIELHRLVRRELYEELMKNIVAKYLVPHS